MLARVFLSSLIVTLTVASSGCERLRAYKTAWHDTQDSNRTGSLSVSVEPREGISIVLDGNRVAQVSPFHDESMPLGQHVLEVRGMGYYPVTFPVTLERAQPVHIPVRLRVRAPTPFVPDALPGGSGETKPPLPAASTANPAQAPAAKPTATGAVPGARAPLPGNTRSLRLTVESRPACAISVDGTPADADNVLVHHGDGTLLIGEMRLSYRVRPGRALELVIPHDSHERSAWWVGDVQVKAKSVVRISANPVVLRRKAGGKLQTATLRRLD